MTYTEKMFSSFGENTDFATTLKLMLKLEGTIITVQYPDDFQEIYVVGARETVMYKFYEHKIYDRDVKPYGTNPTMCGEPVCKVLDKLCKFDHIIIMIKFTTINYRTFLSQKDICIYYLLLLLLLPITNHSLITP